LRCGRNDAPSHAADAGIGDDTGDEINLI
jgi:hypothetical protein